MSVAPSSDEVLNPLLNQPKQARLLGAEVKGLGIITAVSAHPGSIYVLVLDEHGFEHHRFASSLERHEVVFAREPHTFRCHTRRVGYGVWDEVLELEDVDAVMKRHAWDTLEVAA